MNAQRSMLGDRSRWRPRTPFTKGLSTLRVEWRIKFRFRSKKDQYQLIGGPFAKMRVPLTDGTTMKFSITLRGVEWRGRYCCGLVGSNAKWVPNE